MKRKEKRGDKKIALELMKGKPRNEEEKFSLRFSDTQLNAVLLIILASTFLVQGIVRYFELIDKIEYLRLWFYIILIGMFFLSTSVITITLGNIVSILKTKRKINLISFSTFIMGFLFFLLSLVFLLFVI